jgi:tRNA (guanosine-2'-O-)-methyltransferase
VDNAFLVEHLKNHVTPERWARIESVVQNRRPHVSVVLEDIYDRGNASAVMRSAEAFGLYDLHMIQLSEKFKESKRVTQGAHKWLDIKKWKSTASCVENLKKSGYKIYVTHLDAHAKPLSDVDMTQPFALCFGNEKHGASAEILSMADERVYIPMQGFVQSFNISVAAALCFYHINLRAQLPALSIEERLRLQALYLTRTIEHWDKYLPLRPPTKS